MMTIKSPMHKLTFIHVRQHLAVCSPCNQAGASLHFVRRLRICTDALRTRLSRTCWVQPANGRYSALYSSITYRLAFEWQSV